MKISFGLLLFLFSSFVSYSQVTNQRCGFSIESVNGQKFTLMVDGVKQNKVAATQVKAVDLTRDVVNVKIVWQQTSLPALEQKMFLRKGEIEYYRLSQKADKQYALIFEMSEELPAYYPENYSYQPAHINPYCCPPSGNFSANRCFRPEPSSSLNYIYQVISSESFESDKFVRAKEAVMFNCLTSGQIAQLLSVFSFESTRLAFAKFAYAYAFDPSAYFVVAYGFEYQSSKNELEKFIRQHHN